MLQFIINNILQINWILLDFKGTLEMGGFYDVSHG